jgi:hypothetical protein
MDIECDCTNCNGTCNAACDVNINNSCVDCRFDSLVRINWINRINRFNRLYMIKSYDKLKLITKQMMALNKECIFDSNVWINRRNRINRLNRIKSYGRLNMAD